jgi:hypothetical protein
VHQHDRRAVLGTDDVDVVPTNDVHRNHLWPTQSSTGV